MFYIFYIESLYELKKIKDIVLEILDIRLYGEFDVITDEESEFEVVNDYFNLSIDGCSQSIGETSDDYGLNLNYRFWMEMDANQTDLIEKVMLFIGRCMHILGGNCILLSNGDTPILIRNNVKTIVDDNKLEGTEKFPFEKLGIQFDRGEI